MLEVLIVLIVLGVIIAVTVNRVSTSGNELITETDLLKSNLRFAQLKALTNNNDDDTRWRINFSGTSYTLVKLLKDGSTDASANTNFPSDNSPTHQLTAGVTVTSPTSVTYNFRGEPGTTDITVQLKQGNNSAGFTITRTTGFIP
ncbi:MAG: hypothetical protein KA113_06415 [Syntrophaceae bacterium]|nr:hypothetical protein [Syntrophaceae bacterium]